MYNANELLMDGIRDMVFAVRVENESVFIYEFLNRAAMEGTGLDQSVLGKSVLEVYREETATFLHKQYMKVVTSEDSVTYEDSYIAPSGKKFYSKATLTPLFDDKKQYKQIVAVVKDISKEKWAELETEKAWDNLNESRKRYQSLFHHNSDAIISFDLNGRVTNGNVTVESVTGYTPMELIGMNLNALVVKEDVNLVNNLFMQAVAGTTENSRMAIITKQGNRAELSLKVTPLIIDDKVVGIYGILKDITDFVNTQKKLVESEKRFRIIAEHAQDLITLLDEKGEILYVSPSYKNILGFDHKEYVGKFFLHNVHPDDRSLMNEVFLTSVKNGEPFTVQFKQYNNQNELIWSEAHGTPIFDDQHTFKHMVVLTRDINLQKEYESKLRHFAHHDSLTGLPNRRLFKDHLNQALEDFQLNMDGLAVIMMDIDHFKAINDTMGHDIGDEVIEEFGKRVSQTIRNNDIVARLGGDEFVILLPHIGSESNAISIAKDIQKALEKPWNMKDNVLEITTSMGIAMVPAQDATAFSMLKNADLALYEAKDAGRNSYKVRDIADHHLPSKKL